ncbi:alpha/beta fold hydrolase [Agromyces aurantiacus]|uniref:Alpha/beta fold hydrolase n=1 Tax=Agromyces aurantiacus TaxID=165814 RepID=A0ABV9RE89_9MICO|nr:alpha/beta hydrolase [Agromyces aurantiacus]MBM7504634.1 pimeloyl-ACP methyl ester carboxylesterase [Agromyces aurantiacus]
MPRAHVVLVHGIRTSATMWRGQVARLERHDVEAIPVDLPGHGRRIDEPFTVDGAVGAIDEALATTGADDDGVPRLLVGLSLGGYLAIEYAARHPDRLDGLVAASCGTRPRGPALRGYLALAAAINRLPDRGRALNDATARLFLSRTAVDDVLAGGVALDVMRPALTAVAGLDVERSIAAVEVPIWFVNGRYDHFRLEERRMVRAARDGRLVIIDRATHLVSLVRPDDFTAAVLGAVAELEVRAERRRRSVPAR